MKRIEKNVEETIRAGLCTGCGTCVGMCPTSAIKIIEINGRYIPKVDMKKCNHCGICFKVCPGHSVNFKRLSLMLFGKEPQDILMGNYINCYLGSATDLNVRYNSASGGLVTALLIFAIEEGIIDGALVTKMSDRDPLKPKVFVARTKDEIISASKSKYCPVAANIALKEIQKEDGKFATVGLPCHIQGIRKAEMINRKLRRKILLHFGLICHNSPTFLATTYLLQKMNLRNEDVKKIDYRSGGWPGGLLITLKNGTKKFIQEFNPFYWGFVFSSCFFPERCILCIDKICDLSDLSFGDAWHLSTSKIGESIVISRNKIGQELLQKAMAANEIRMKEIESSQIVKSQGLYLVKRQHKARVDLFEKLGKKVPIYNQELLDPKTLDYFKALALYLNTYVSSKRYLWNLIDIFPSLLACVRGLPLPR